MFFNQWSERTFQSIKMSDNARNASVANRQNTLKSRGLAERLALYSKTE